MAFSGQVADRPADLFLDYMGAVRVGQKSPSQQAIDRSMYACVQVFGNRSPGKQHIRSVSHVKSHRSGT
eukprot:278928-Pyramimonas_sp.AAC.1